MNKKNRDIIFAKFGGKCAYCGTELSGKWHVDEILPVLRKKKFQEGFWKHKITGERLKDEIPDDWDDYIYENGKMVNDGCKHPERFNTDNQYPSCASCNINKHSLSLEEFRLLISGFMKHLNQVSTQYKIAKRYGLIQETDIQVKFYFETL